jgi:hypothetical protein
MSKTEKKTPVVVSLTELKKLVTDGKSKDEIATHFGLTGPNTAKLLKEAGLVTKRKIVPAYKLVTEPVDKDLISMPTKGSETATDDEF